MVHELAERGVREGERGRYACSTVVSEISVPATLTAAALIVCFAAGLRRSAQAGDKASLAIAMTGLVSEHMRHARMREGLQLSAEQMALVESIGDPALAVGAAFAAISIKAQNGEMTDAMQWAQTTIDWAAGDTAKTGLVVASPLAIALAFRCTARWWLGRPGWREDLDEALAIARNADPWTVGFVNAWVYGNAVHTGVLAIDDTAMGELEQALQIAEASGDDTVLGSVKYTFATVLTSRGRASDRHRRIEMLVQVRDMCLHHRFPMCELPVVEAFSGYERARGSDRDRGLSQMRKALDDLPRPWPVADAKGAGRLIYWRTIYVRHRNHHPSWCRRC